MGIRNTKKRGKGFITTTKLETIPIGSHRFNLPYPGFLEELGIVPALKRVPNGEVGLIELDSDLDHFQDGDFDIFYEYIHNLAHQRSDRKYRYSLGCWQERGLVDGYLYNQLRH